MKKYLFKDVIPVAKPRMTRRDKWMQRPVVMHYRQFANQIRAMAFVDGFEPSGFVEIEFFIPMPISWSKKKKQKHYHTPHLARPDIDNLIKAVFDSLWDDDKSIYHVKATKQWSDIGKIIISVK